MKKESEYSLFNKILIVTWCLTMAFEIPCISLAILTKNDFFVILYWIALIPMAILWIVFFLG